MSSNGLLPPPTIGARVWAMYQGARRAGKVLSVNDKRGIFKMRFDDFPTAEFDYSFEYNSPVWSYIEAPPPTSTDMMITSVKTSDNENEPLFTIAKKFKTLIKVKFLFVFSIAILISRIYFFFFSLCYHLIGN